MALTGILLQKQQSMFKGESIKKDNKPVKLNSGQWYAAQLEQAANIGKCECCGADLAPSMVINPRTVIAHILAKDPKKFPSVATASQNRFFSCSLCHVKYDEASSEEIEAMPLFPVLVERLKTFYNLITEAEKSKLPACFRLDAIAE